MRPILRLPTLLLLLAALTPGCTERRTEPTRPMLVVGIDGAEWSVIERMWADGELPALAELARRGTRARLATDYGISPAIWTTIATGRRPAEHGIRDFVVAGEHGDVPVTSAARRVPALWNMATRRGRTVAVLGWWATWPAEPVRGVVLSDRALQEPTRRAFPPEVEAMVDRLAAGEAIDDADSPWDLTEIAQRRDRLVALAAAELAAEEGDRRPYDLTLLYFRSADIESHNHWRYFDPRGFPPADPGLDPAELAARADRIPAAYRAIDRAIGAAIAAAPPDTNVLVVSDHGFRGADGERVQLLFDLDLVLERLGYLRRTADGGVDVARSRLYAYRSPPNRREQLLRFGGAAAERHRADLRQRLDADLAAITWPGGEPVFRVRDARPRERRDGAELVVIVRRDGAAGQVILDGRPWPAPVRHAGRISGIHHRHTAGVLLAAGPDVEPGAEVDGIGIHDLAPTILYGIGLPAAEDFAGRVWTELFTPGFRRRHPVTTIPTWGTREAAPAPRSAADSELLEELGALGYL